MKLTISQIALDDALQKILPVVPKKAAISAYLHVLITAGDVLEFRATDGDKDVRFSVGADIADAGSIAVQARTLADIVKKMPKGGDVKIAIDGANLTVSSGRSRFKLATLDAEDFPIFASDEFDTVAEFDAVEIATLFGKTAFAASTEETRYYLNGVYLHNDADGYISGVATDGHRLAKWRSTLTDQLTAVIVPNDTIAAISFPATGNVTIHASETKIKFSTGTWSLTSKVVDGTYPDYSRIIPDDNKIKATFNGNDLKKAVDRVTTVMDSRGSAVVMSVSADGINVSGRDGSNAAEDVVDCDLDGEPITIGFNPKYINAGMQHLFGDAVAAFGNPMSPAIITDSGDDAWSLVLMPMRA